MVDGSLPPSVCLELDRVGLVHSAAEPLLSLGSGKAPGVFMRHAQVRVEVFQGTEVFLPSCCLCRTRFRNTKGKSVKKSRDWILEKKERRRRQGK